MMKKWFLGCLIFVTPWALADGHGGLTREKREADTSMTVTSAQIRDAVSVINAERDRGADSRVYFTIWNTMRHAPVAKSMVRVVASYRMVRRPESSQFTDR